MKRAILLCFILLLLVTSVFAQEKEFVEFSTAAGFVIKVPIDKLDDPEVNALVKEIIRTEFIYEEGRYLNHPDVKKLQSKGVLFYATGEAVKGIFGERDAGSFLTFILFGLLIAVPLVVVFHEAKLKAVRKRRK